MLTDSSAYRVQLGILAGLMAVYLALGFWWLPPENRFLLLLGPLVVGAAGWLGRRQGPRHAIGQEPIAIWLGCFLILFLPVGGSSPESILPGFGVAGVGVVCALGLWAVHRFPADAPTRAGRSFGEEFRSSVEFGLLLASGLSLLVTGVFVVFGILQFVGLTNDPMLSVRSWAWIVGAYFAGGFSGGVVVGLLRRLARWPLGAMLVGIPVGTLVYGSVGIALKYIDPEMADMTSQEHIGLAIIIGFLAGPLGGLIVKGLRLEE